MDAIEKAHRDEQVLVPKTIIGAESTKAASIRQPYIPYSSLSTPIPGNLPALLKAARENKEAMRTATVILFYLFVAICLDRYCSTTKGLQYCCG